MANENTIATVEQTAKEKALTEAVSQVEFYAESIVIDDEDDYKKAGDFGRKIKQRAAEVKDFWKPIKEAAHKAHAEICNKEKEMLAPLANAERIVKRTMSDYIAEQERKRREIEAAARKAAEEEAARKLREAIEQEEKGNFEAAENAAKEAEMTENAAATIVLPQSKPQASGVGVRKDWEIVNIDNGKVPVNFSGCELRPVDKSAVMRLIRMSKGTIQIPGVQYKEVAAMSFRR